jgi:hypothetical protein
MKQNNLQGTWFFLAVVSDQCKKVYGVSDPLLVDFEDEQPAHIVPLKQQQKNTDLDDASNHSEDNGEELIKSVRPRPPVLDIKVDATARTQPKQ